MTKELPPKLESPEHHFGNGFEVSMLSSASEKHPTRNEDAALLNTDAKLFGVLDGMGGHSSGDVASRLGKQYIEETFKKFPKNMSLEQTEEALEAALEEANKQILKQGNENPDLAGMGTTAALATIWEGKNGERKAVVAHIGDSRVYLLRSDGKLEQITEDDSDADPKKIKSAHEKLVDQKMDPSELEPEEWGAFSQRNGIKQALGGWEMIPNIYAIDIREGERLLITSDGIHDNLTDKEIEKILTENSNLQTATQELLKASLTRSRMDRDIQPAAKQDDMSAIVIEIQRQIKGRETPEIKEFKIGEKVLSPTREGKPMSGWKIASINKEKGSATLIPEHIEDPAEAEIRKEISLEELSKLNPQ